MAKPERTENPITVEDLLRLKRHEQPDEAFWATFEERLHQKTLQNLVKRDRWVTRLRARLSSAAHPAFAMPAAAAIALGIFIASPLKQELAQDTTAEVVQAQPEIATEQVVHASFSSDEVDTRFASNTIAFDTGNEANYTKLRANQSLTTDHENVTYAASTYTTAQYSYASMPANAVY